MYKQAVIICYMKANLANLEYLRELCKNTPFDREDILKSLDILITGVDLTTNCMAQLLIKEGNDT
jgi:hypothetical protein